jgi:hypothetical protein
VTCATKFLFRRAAEGGVTFRKFRQAIGAKKIETHGRREKFDFSSKKGTFTFFGPIWGFRRKLL